MHVKMFLYIRSALSGSGEYLPERHAKGFYAPSIERSSGAIEHQQLLCLGERVGINHVFDMRVAP